MSRLSRLTNRLQIFISYSHQDRAFVARLVRDLQDNAIEPWVDQHELLAGESITAAIERAIGHADIFLVVISPDSMSSRWVQEELEMISVRTTEESAVLIPLVIKNVALTPRLKGRKYVDFRSRYKRAFQELLQSLEKWDQRRRENWLLREIEECKRSPSEGMVQSYRLTELGSVALSTHNYPQAIAALQEAVSVHPENWDAQHLLSIAHMRSGDWDAAAQRLHHLVSLPGQEARALYNLSSLWGLCAARANADGDLRLQRKSLALCYKNLRAAVDAGFLRWLAEYDHRSFPARDVERDPDLVFAINHHAEIRDYVRVLVATGLRTNPADARRRFVGGSGGGCVAAGTRVAVGRDESVEIQDLRCGNAVRSYGADSSELTSTVKRTMRLWESSGCVLNDTLVLTDTQHVLCVHGWTPASGLRAGDVLLVRGGGSEVVRALEPWQGLREVYHLALQGTPTYYASRYILHNDLAKIE